MIGESIQHRLMLIAIVVAVLVCLLLWLTGRAIARAIALISFVLGICVLSFVCGPSLGGPDNWSAVLAVATLLAVVAALFLDDIRALLHRPKIELRVEPGLVDFGPDFDAPIDDARWIRGSITNIGDRGLQRCRLKLLRIKGPNLPPNANRIQNGFLQWQGGIRDSMRLNRGERWIFDIGSRRDIQNAPMRPFTHFVTRGPSISCNLQAPAIYTFTLGIYGDNIPSTERRIRVSVGQAAGDIRFPG